MPLSAQTIIGDAYAQKYDALSDRSLLLCLVGYYSTVAGLTAATCLPLAYAQKYDALSDQALAECLLDVLS